MRYNELWRILHDSGYAEGEAKAVTRMLLTDKYGMTTADMLCEEIENYSDAHTLSEDVSALKAFTPVQYVVGKAWFATACSQCAPDVLSPVPKPRNCVVGLKKTIILQLQRYLTSGQAADV